MLEIRINWVTIFLPNLWAGFGGAWTIETIEFWGACYRPFDVSITYEGEMTKIETLILGRILGRRSIYKNWQNPKCLFT